MARYDVDTLALIRAYPAWKLAQLADSYAQNEQAESFFTSIRDNVLEGTEYVDPDDWQREYVEDYSGQAHLIADAAPDVYTWTKWQEFVGTQAWQEDVEELQGSDVTDLDSLATLALCVIAERLVSELAELINESISDDDESE